MASLYKKHSVMIKIGDGVGGIVGAAGKGQHVLPKPLGFFDGFGIEIIQRGYQGLLAYLCGFVYRKPILPKGGINGLRRVYCMCRLYRRFLGRFSRQCFWLKNYFLCIFSIAYILFQLVDIIGKVAYGGINYLLVIFVHVVDGCHRMTNNAVVGDGGVTVPNLVVYSTST